MTARNDRARAHAARRGLDFLHQASQDDQLFDRWAGDFLWCFYTISATSGEPSLRDAAREICTQAARRWQARQHGMPCLTDPHEVANIASIIDTAERIGVKNPALRDYVRDRVHQFTPCDYLGFDPAEEAPPADAPEPCPSCGVIAGRSVAQCGCGEILSFRSRYEIWTTALVFAYTGESFGEPLGARYPDILRWLPVMRPYRGNEGGQNEEFNDTAYAVTHLIYTLSDYHRYRLSPDWLPQEFKFLMANVENVLASGDTELLGEFIDCLRAFGVPVTAPFVCSGIEYLLTEQNSDGSWGDPGNSDLLTICHTTWTAIDALRDYEWCESSEIPDLVETLAECGGQLWQPGSASRLS